MNRAEAYRLREKEAEEAANKARDPEVKQTFRHIASRWREIAERADIAERAQRNGW
jgi:hypothetical protein